MKVFAKQIKSDFYTMIWDSMKVVLAIPVMYILIMMADGEVWNPRSFLTMVVLLAVPAGLISMAATRLTSTIQTALSMGSTRRAFYISNLIFFAVMSLVVTIMPLVITGLITLPFMPQAGKEIFSLVISLPLLGIAFCVDTLAVGVGTLMGGLVNRFGRKVFVIMVIILILLGGVCGGLIAMFAINGSEFLISNQVIAIASVSAFVVGLILYGFGWKTVKKYYVS